MDAADLDRRSRTYDGWIPPWLVSLLVEHGHIDQVRQQARQGDWFCADAWARVLIEQGRRDAALESLAPFVAAGWWVAAERVADILSGWGRTDEAIALVRPYAEGGERLAVAGLAKLLARHGRGDEALELLRPYTGDWYLAEALVEVTADLGRDDEVVELLETRIDAARRSDAGPWAEPWIVIGLLAAVHERQGRVDAAVALLRASSVKVVNGRDRLADLLARYDREDELRDYVAGNDGHRGEENGEEAAYRLAELLDERGDVDGAAEALRPFVADGWQNSAVRLAGLLARNGRVDEAIETLRPAANSRNGDCEWIVREMWTMLADHGRVEEAFEFIDELAGRTRPLWWELLCERAWLLSRCGRTEQAITELRAHPEAGTWYGAWRLADLLAEAGRLDEAIEVLLPTSSGGRNEINLARLLILRGRVKDALTVLHDRTVSHDRTPVLPVGDDPWASLDMAETPPF